MTDPITLVVFALTSLATLVAEAIGLAVHIAYNVLAALSVPPPAQTALIIIFVVMLIGAAVRLFGRLAAALILVLLLLMVLHHGRMEHAPAAQGQAPGPSHGQVQL